MLEINQNYFLFFTPIVSFSTHAVEIVSQMPDSAVYSLIRYQNNFRNISNQYLMDSIPSMKSRNAAVQIFLPEPFANLSSRMTSLAALRKR